MIPTFRLLLFLLLGSLLVAGVALVPVLLWLALGYLLAVGALVVVDYVITTKPAAIELERINDTKLSLGAENLITLLLANRGRRPISFQLRDEYPYQFIADATFLSGEVAPYDIHEARYHVKPLQRGDYRFGDINIRYPSALRTFVRQARYSAEAPVKVYPNVLDVRKYDLLARKGLLFELGLRAARIFGTGTEFERLREYNTDDEFRRINWKATARRGKPIAAEFETERSQYIMGVIDTGRLMRPPIGDPGQARLCDQHRAAAGLCRHAQGRPYRAADLRRRCAHLPGAQARQGPVLPHARGALQCSVRAGRGRLWPGAGLPRRQAQAPLAGGGLHRPGDA